MAAGVVAVVDASGDPVPVFEVVVRTIRADGHEAASDPVRGNYGSCVVDLPAIDGHYVHCAAKRAH